MTGAASLNRVPLVACAPAFAWLLRPVLWRSKKTPSDGRRGSGHTHPLVRAAPCHAGLNRGVFPSRTLCRTLRGIYYIRGTRAWDKLASTVIDAGRGGLRPLRGGRTGQGRADLTGGRGDSLRGSRGLGGHALERPARRPAKADACGCRCRSGGTIIFADARNAPPGERDARHADNADGAESLRSSSTIAPSRPAFRSHIGRRCRAIFGTIIDTTDP